VHDSFSGESACDFKLTFGKALVTADERSIAAQEAEAAERQHLEQMEVRSRAAFLKRARKLHHLVGTRLQPGVYRTPLQVASGTVPTVDGTPVEDHLRIIQQV
jgi:hypothetical protein